MPLAVTPVLVTSHTECTLSDPAPLNAVCPERKAVIKCSERIIRRQQSASPVRKDERPRRREEGMTHDSPRV